MLSVRQNVYSNRVPRRCASHGSDVCSQGYAHGTQPTHYMSLSSCVGRRSVAGTRPRKPRDSRPEDKRTQGLAPRGPSARWPSLAYGESWGSNLCAHVSAHGSASPDPEGRVTRHRTARQPAPLLARSAHGSAAPLCRGSSNAGHTAAPPPLHQGCLVRDPLAIIRVLIQRTRISSTVR